MFRRDFSYECMGSLSNRTRVPIRGNPGAEERVFFLKRSVHYDSVTP